jgi:hypothetical protein
LPEAGSVICSYVSCIVPLPVLHGLGRVECLENVLLAYRERSRAPDGDTAMHVGETGLEVEERLEHEDDMLVEDGFSAELVMDENIDVNEVVLAVQLTIIMELELIFESSWLNY